MEESYETFEEELGPPRADPPPQKPVRQIRRPEMYATRKIREEMTPQQPRAEPKILPREPSFPRTTTIPKALSIQNLTVIEKPWENVTLNRCLFVAITILVMTSGFQKLHEAMRGQTLVEDDDEVELVVRRQSALRNRRLPAEPEPTIWEVMFWWLPDLDDEDDDDEEEDDDGGVRKGKSKSSKAHVRGSKSHRNRPLPDKKLMKQREGKLKDRRAKKAKDEEIKKKEKDTIEEPDQEADDDEDAEEEEVVAEPRKTKNVVEKKEKKTIQ